MSLYLCIFDGDEDIDGVDVGGYSDFNALRDFIVSRLESGQVGSRFPTFVMHSDCDGEWTQVECQKLAAELAEIEASLKQLDAVAFASDWQKAVARSLGLQPKSALESFVDVDGEILVSRILSLTRKALSRDLPVSFQ